MVRTCLFRTTSALTAFLTIMGLGASHPVLAAVDYDWGALSATERIAIVHPFFAKSDRKTKPSNVQDRNHEKRLQELCAVLKQTLVKRLKEQERFSVAPDSRVEQALRSLHWSAGDLFLKQGVVAGKRWPQPDMTRLSLLARRLNVDAVLIGEMYEPASIGDSAAFGLNLGSLNPMNMGIKQIHPHVISPRVQAYLITLSGIVAWKDEQMADHPRTTPRTEHTLMLDWKEATEQVACQVADSLLRMPPPDR